MKTRRNRSATLFDLTGKVAFVTGGGRGIGKALAKGLAQFGCDVAVVDINLQDQKSVVREIEKQGRKCLFLDANVSDFQSINEAVENTLSKFRKIDILVNNAGVDIRKPALEFTETEWDLIVDTKGLFSGFYPISWAISSAPAPGPSHVTGIVEGIAKPAFKAGFSVPGLFFSPRLRPERISPW